MALLHRKAYMDIKAVSFLFLFLTQYIPHASSSRDIEILNAPQRQDDG